MDAIGGNAGTKKETEIAGARRTVRRQLSGITVTLRCGGLGKRTAMVRKYWPQTKNNTMEKAKTELARN